MAKTRLREQRATTQFRNKCPLINQQGKLARDCLGKTLQGLHYGKGSQSVLVRVLRTAGASFWPSAPHFKHPWIHNNIGHYTEP